MTTANKQFTAEEISNIKFVKNVSGASLYIHDLSEDGKEGNGITIPPNKIVELSALASAPARRRSRGLKRALEGISADSGFTPTPPTLVVVESFHDETHPDKVVLGSTLSKTNPVPANDNFYDIARMEQDLRDMEEELESIQIATKRMEMQNSINFLKQEIEKKKQTTKMGVDANVVVAGKNKEL